MGTKSRRPLTIDRTAIPGPQPLPRISLDAPKRFQLRNGLRIVLFEKHELPVVSFTLVIGAGSDRDARELPGQASMTAALIDEGTAGRSALTIAGELDRIGAQLNVRTSHDATYVSMSTLKRHMSRALDIVADIMMNASFSEEEFERQRARRLTTLMEQQDQPSTVATLAFHHVLYGRDHPYGRDTLGTTAALRSMSRNDLLQFYRSFFHPLNATLIVVGDTTLNEATEYLGRLFGGWAGNGLPDAAAPGDPAPMIRKVYMIDRPGSVQSEIRVGYAALSRSTPDYFPVLVMNRALGGQFSSRLNLNLREQRGITYGVHSSFSFQRRRGPFTAAGAVNRDATDVALREILHEIDRMHNEGITPEELEFVKKGLTGNFVLGFETPSQIASVLATMVLHGLPDTFYLTYLQALNAVTLDDVRRAARLYLDSSKMALLFVGDVDKVRASVEAAGLGEVLVTSLNGN